jgi:HEAT repeat protein
VSAEDSELELQLMLVESPFGGDPHRREAEAAAEWLLARPERAYPRLLARAAEGSATPALVELLGRFGRADAVPVLAGLLGGPELVAAAAADALAHHPAAADALRAGLRRGGEAAARSADALAARGDAGACPDLLAAARDPDARVRYHAVQAAVRLGCPDAVALAESDADPDVRALARRSGAG